MANLKTIQERLEASQPLSQIHRDLQESLDDMPYARFTYYIRKHITHAKRKLNLLNAPEPGIKRPIQRDTTEQSPRFIPPDTAPDMSKYI